MDKKGAKEEINTLWPSLARPDAIPIKFCSLIPTDRYLSGYCALNRSNPDDLPRSADKTIRLSHSSAIFNIN
jgi:hypothetical protein